MSVVRGESRCHRALPAEVGGRGQVRKRAVVVACLKGDLCGKPGKKRPAPEYACPCVKKRGTPAKSQSKPRTTGGRRTHGLPALLPLCTCRRLDTAKAPSEASAAVPGAPVYCPVRLRASTDGTADRRCRRPASGEHLRCRDRRPRRRRLLHIRHLFNTKDGRP